MPNIVIKKKALADIKPLVDKVLVKTKVVSSQVVAVFDVSGSTSEFYSSGIIDALATRVLALGLKLDDNGQIPVYALDDSVRRLPDLTEENFQDYTQRLHRLVGGGTNYAPTIRKIVEDAQAGDPMLVLLFTDGDNFDHREAEDAIVKASKLPIFFQWYGIYRRSKPRFSFLEELNDLKNVRKELRVDNCGFSPLGLDIVGANDVHDENEDIRLYEDMLKEYKDFPQKAKDADVKWENKSMADTVGGFFSNVLGKLF